MSICITSYLWESIYVIKQMHDHNRAESLLSVYGDMELDGDLFYELAVESSLQVFSDTRRYFNDEHELETLVFFDPVLTEFYVLCEEYEKARKLSKEKNRYRYEAEAAILSGLSFDDYSYNYHVYTDPLEHGGCRIALLLYVDFYSHYAVPGGLLHIYDALNHGIERIKKELYEEHTEFKEAA